MTLREMCEQAVRKTIGCVGECKSPVCQGRNVADTIERMAKQFAERAIRSMPFIQEDDGTKAIYGDPGGEYGGWMYSDELKRMIQEAIAAAERGE